MLASMNYSPIRIEVIQTKRHVMNYLWAYADGLGSRIVYEMLGTLYLSERAKEDGWNGNVKVPRAVLTSP